MSSGLQFLLRSLMCNSYLCSSAFNVFFLWLPSKFLFNFWFFGGWIRVGARCKRLSPMFFLHPQLSAFPIVPELVKGFWALLPWEGATLFLILGSLWPEAGGWEGFLLSRSSLRPSRPCVLGLGGVGAFLSDPVPLGVAKLCWELLAGSVQKSFLPFLSE